MIDQIGYYILGIMAGLLLFALIYVATWTPKHPMKGHSGRKCKCCNR